jgi:hypothetical protein
MSEAFSKMLPQLNIQLSIPEIDQLKRRDVQIMESPRFVSQISQSALNNMNNVYIMTEVNEMIPENTLRKQVLAI